ncbi:phage regulatory CII family protein [Propionivibrio sp.]|uniref:phage regulatory CII family protein n=1 Tax=Propionivibrio sp. TaxID=2212460 RepID=UPI0039E2B58C
MDVFEAAYRVAHDYKGGAANKGGAVRMAQDLGENPGTFLNRLNPEQETHKLWLATSVRMQVVSRDHRILHAMGATLGEVCFPVPDLSNVSDTALVELVCRIGDEGGDFYRAINAGLSGARFSRADYGRIRKEGQEYMAAIAETMARIEGLVDD